jgi:hypothetical protein
MREIFSGAGLASAADAPQQKFEGENEEKQGERHSLAALHRKYWRERQRR